jgi:hypothetical protein
MSTVLPKAARILTLVAAVAALTAGCPDEEVTHSRVAKEPPPDVTAPLAPAPTAMPSAPAGPLTPPAHPMAGDVPLPPKPMGGEGLSWTLPKGWTQSLSGGIRYATLKPAGGGSLDASVVVLPGEAGGELANVNRWRSQIGLAQLDAAALPSARKVLNTKVGPLSLYDFSSEGAQKTRLVAGLAVVNGSSWFFKMTGEAGAVGASLPGFTQLVESLQPAANAR